MPSLQRYGIMYIVQIKFKMELEDEILISKALTAMITIIYIEVKCHINYTAQCAFNNTIVAAKTTARKYSTRTL